MTDQEQHARFRLDEVIHAPVRFSIVAALAHVEEADFVAKARAGSTDETRLCLSCNQECVGRMGLNRWLGCIENPRTGRESEGVGTVQLTTKPKSVMVVGAGPAGLQAAIAARRNGHQVTVYEKEPQAGGQVRLAALALMPASSAFFVGRFTW